MQFLSIYLIQNLYIPKCKFDSTKGRKACEKFMLYFRRNEIDPMNQIIYNGKATVQITVGYWQSPEVVAYPGSTVSKGTGRGSKGQQNCLAVK